MRKAILALVPLVAFGTLCGCRKGPADFPAFTQEFIDTTLALSPTGATAAGYHKHNGIELDAHLDDFSAAGIESSRAAWMDLKAKLERFDRDKFDAESRADAELIESQIKLAELEDKEIQSWKHSPTLYVETIGNGLYVPYSVEYAPAEQRWRHIISRLGEVPRIIEEAKRQLVDAPPVWKNVAAEENEGTIGLIEQTFPEKVPPSLKGDYDAAATPATAAMRGFNDWLKSSLKDADAESWRLGKERYAKKFALVMGTDMRPEQILAQAEEALRDTRRELFAVALPLHHKLYPTHVDPVDMNLIVGETFKKIDEQHPRPEAYMDEARKALEETRAFLKAHPNQLVKDPPRDNLQVIETPVFMRGGYGVGGFNPAPPMEPQLGAFYWVTPIPKHWPKERVESKLREYNNYGLRILTIHEAIPGHYVQAEYASTIEPMSRRMLRAIYGSGVYVEGWAVYATAEMLKAGYLDKSPELKMQNLKWELRAIANTILDIKYHTMGLTDDEAMTLMMDRTFQEREEAVAKVQRAKLSSCQLTTYFTGYSEWKRLRAAAEVKEGKSFNAGAFNERALREGALPMQTLERVLGLEQTAARQ
ncbi:MAG: DUF885 domain-containing protein [Bryobacteraceae bacterium]|jgi:uncharacterized protein (DUF885 family)